MAETNALLLLGLSDGWDSYGGLRPEPDVVIRSDVIGARLADLFSTPAQYVPCSDGSVQVEWHSDGWDVEVWVGRSGQ